MGSTSSFDPTPTTPVVASTQFEDTKNKAKALWTGLSDEDMKSASNVDQLATVIQQRFGGQTEVILQKLGSTPNK